MKEKISVIIPVYQVESYLKKCIDTVIEQTYQNIEIILIDDGSKDNCPQICEEYAQKDTRIKVIHKENEGLSEARNVGIENATGEYLFFVDSDDWVDTDILGHLYKIMLDTKSDIVECQYEKAYQERTIAKQEKETVQVIEAKQALENLITESCGNHVVTWNKLYKKEIFSGIRFPKGKLHEDEFTTYKLLYQANCIAVTSLKLYYYRQRENSIITTKFGYKRLDIIQAFEEKLEFYQEKGEMQLYRLEIAKFLYILMYCYYYAKKSKLEKDTIKNIKKKYRKTYRKYLKTNKIILSKEKIKYGLVYLIPNIVFSLPLI